MNDPALGSKKNSKIGNPEAGYIPIIVLTVLHFLTKRYKEDGFPLFLFWNAVCTVDDLFGNGIPAGCVAASPTS